MSTWLLRGLPDAEPGSTPPPLVTRTPKQIRNHASYIVKKLRPRAADDRFERSFRERHVALSSHEDGMGYLSLNHDIASLRAVDYRVTLLAKHMRARPEETRTIAQLRSDLTVDLLLGRLTADATTGELEQPETSATGDPLDQVHKRDVGRWARPVINLTVPLQTVAGVSDEPGVLAGGEVLPAALCRRLARDPDSTWYRMVTDPVGEMVALSTASYRPTREIWRHVVARDQTCTGQTCVTPATTSELDHRAPWPSGPTSTDNLHAVCRVHHQAKHAPGFAVSRAADGRTVLHTAAGFAHLAERPLRPGSTDWGCLSLLDDLQPTAAELAEALSAVALQRRQQERCAATAWEIAQEEADYRASYPDASDEDIWSWVYDEHAAEASPPILTRGRTLIEAEMRAQAGVDRYQRLRESALSD